MTLGYHTLIKTSFIHSFIHILQVLWFWGWKVKRHKVQKHIEGDPVAGMSYAVYRVTGL